jgi:hypothetical protein
MHKPLPSLPMLLFVLAISIGGQVFSPTKCFALKPDDVADLLVVALTKTDSSESPRVIMAHYEVERDGDIILIWREATEKATKESRLIVSEVEGISVYSAADSYGVKVSVGEASAGLWSIENGERQGYQVKSFTWYSQQGAFEVKRLLKELQESIKINPRILPRYLDGMKKKYYEVSKPGDIKKFETMKPESQKVVLKGLWEACNRLPGFFCRPREE